jgi:type II secretory pathway component PulF
MLCHPWRIGTSPSMAPETGGNTPDGVLNLEDALAVRFEEGREEGMEEGMEKGMEKGMEEGMEKGMEKGVRELADLIQKGYSLNDALKLISKEKNRDGRIDNQ